MSSIIKSPFVSFLEQKKTIEIVSGQDTKIINRYVNHSKVNEEISATDESSEELDPVDDEFLETTYEKPNLQAQVAYEDIIAMANQEAEVIIAMAKDKGQQLEKAAKVKGQKDGLKAGKEEALAQVAQLKLELEEEIRSLEKQKQSLYRSIEPKIAEVVKKLVTNMVGIQKFDKETILFVIKKGLEEVDVQGDLIIKVSSADFDEVMQSKAFLVENMSSQIRLEILKDSKLAKNDCVIETNLGNINCSLNERMDGLLRQLSLIEKSF